jgi:hypothetical protein
MGEAQTLQNEYYPYLLSTPSLSLYRVKCSERAQRSFPRACWTDCWLLPPTTFRMNVINIILFIIITTNNIINVNYLTLNARTYDR